MKHNLQKFDLYHRHDCQSRRHNIEVDGIKESEKEKGSESEEKVRKLFSEKLQLDHPKMELDWVHRTRKPMSSEKSWSVVVKFLWLKNKLAVLDKLKP